jgi:DNA-binding MarR family transcriptional regulator
MAKRSKTRPERVSARRASAAGPGADRAERAARTSDAAPATLTFLRSLWALDHRLRSTSKRMERRLGITAPQRLVLRLLGRSPGLTPSQLADALHLDRGTLSGVLERLVERDLVAREPHPRDGRSVRLQLTGRGRSFDRETPGTVEYCVQRALAGLSPARVRMVCQVLDAISIELGGDAADGTKA